MHTMSFRKAVFFGIIRIRGIRLGSFYKRFLQEDRDGISADTSKKLLIQLLLHCRQSVPHYAAVILRMGDSFLEYPEEYLRNFPILTKDTIRRHFRELKSTDLSRRRWYVDHTSGSTGEPIEFIHDWNFAAQAGAIKILFSKLVGREIGECEVYLWGSRKDISRNTKNTISCYINKITNTIYLDPLCMTPDRMREYIAILNAKRPKLIITYTEAIYQLAKFVESTGLEVLPQGSIITTAETLYPFMREKIEKTFRCKVFNRYGSREMGDIACERPGCEGLWVAPWGNYIEIVDDAGNRLQDGNEGEILVTSLTNYAMPFVRYRIEDRGFISPKKGVDQTKHEQVLGGILGRDTDTFRGRDGVLIHGSFFVSMLWSKNWVSKYQVVQKGNSLIVFRIVRSGIDYQQADVDEIKAKTKSVMGSDCKVEFEFVKDISPNLSGKNRHIISEVKGE